MLKGWLKLIWKFIFKIRGMSLKSLKIFKDNQTGLKNPSKQTSQIIQNFNLILTELNLKIKGFQITEIRQKSKTRIKIIFATELEMSCYQKIEKVRIKFFLVIFSPSRLLFSTFFSQMSFELWFLSIVHPLLIS